MAESHSEVEVESYSEVESHSEVDDPELVARRAQFEIEMREKLCSTIGAIEDTGRNFYILKMVWRNIYDRTGDDASDYDSSIATYVFSEENPAHNMYFFRIGSFDFDCFLNYVSNFTYNMDDFIFTGETTDDPIYHMLTNFDILTFPNPIYIGINQINVGLRYSNYKDGEYQHDIVSEKIKTTAVPNPVLLERVILTRSIGEEIFSQEPDIRITWFKFNQ